MASPNGTKKLAAHALLARVAVGHHAARRREDRDPHARTNARNAIVTDVDAAARRRQTHHAFHRRLFVLSVTKDDGERLATIGLRGADVVDVALGLEDLRDVLL